ncbi:hypothetical protein GCM10027614_41430 [Micromonospora vulcania]
MQRAGRGRDVGGGECPSQPVRGAATCHKALTGIARSLSPNGGIEVPLWRTMPAMKSSPRRSGGGRPFEQARTDGPAL